MTEQILDGVSLALSEAFPGCAVYGDARVRQGLETPSFFISLGECSQRPLPNGMVELRQSVEVVYFPERQGDLGELWAIGSSVLGLLGEITLPDGGRARGSALRCGVSDGLMYIGAAYVLRLKPVEQRALMGDMTLINVND